MLCAGNNLPAGTVTLKGSFLKPPSMIRCTLPWWQSLLHGYRLPHWGLSSRWPERGYTTPWHEILLSSPWPLVKPSSDQYCTLAQTSTIQTTSSRNHTHAWFKIIQRLYWFVSLCLISGIVIFHFYDCMLQICSFEIYKVVILLWLILLIVKLMQSPLQSVICKGT